CMGECFVASELALVDQVCVQQAVAAFRGIVQRDNGTLQEVPAARVNAVEEEQRRRAQYEQCNRRPPGPQRDHRGASHQHPSADATSARALAAHMISRRVKPYSVTSARCASLPTNAASTSSNAFASIWSAGRKANAAHPRSEGRRGGEEGA